LDDTRIHQNGSQPTMELVAPLEIRQNLEFEEGQVNPSQLVLLNALSGKNRLLPWHLKDGINVMPKLDNSKCSTAECMQFAIFCCYDDRPFTWKEEKFKPTCGKPFCLTHTK
jgi:hypothetical protein